MKAPAAPATPPQVTFSLTIQVTAPGRSANEVKELFQKFFDFYHPSLSVKVSLADVQPAQSAPTQPVQLSAPVGSFLD